MVFVSTNTNLENVSFIECCKLGPTYNFFEFFSCYINNAVSEKKNLYIYKLFYAATLMFYKNSLATLVEKIIQQSLIT